MASYKKTLEDLKIKARALKHEILALYLAYKRPDVPWKAKVVAAIVVGYALSPIDFIPDFIPILGYLDDLVLLPLGIAYAIKLIPVHIMDECRAEAKVAFAEGKPQSTVGACIIILIWSLVLVAFVKIFF